MDLVYYPDERLTATAKVVNFNEDSTAFIKALAADMIKAMKMYKGVGLAANQIGQKLALAVIDPSSDPYHTQREPFAIVNPEILEESAPVPCHNEGCLSIPGCSSHLTRFATIKVKYQDLDGKEIIEEANGKLAQIFQHEIDHLNGKLYLDRISPMKQQMVFNKIKKIERHFKQMKKYAL